MAIERAIFSQKTSQTSCSVDRFRSKMRPAKGRTMSSQTATAATIPQSRSQSELASLAPISFWRRPKVQNFLPLGTSLVFHLALVIVGVLGLRTYQTLTEPMREQIIIPEAAIVEGAEVGGIPN